MTTTRRLSDRLTDGTLTLDGGGLRVSDATVATIAAASSDAADAATDAAAAGVVATAAQGTANAAVPQALYDANTVLKADADNTPAALTMGPSTILARLASGGIVAATVAQIRTLLSLVVGTNVQAHSADLDAISALTSAADEVPYSTGAGAWAMAAFTAFGRSLAAAANAAAARVLLALDNVSNDAQLKRSDDDWGGYTLNTTPGSNDIFLMETSAGGLKRRVHFSDVRPVLTTSTFSVFAPPAVPHANDDEATGTVLDPSWTLKDTGGHVVASIVNNHITLDYTANGTISSAWLYKPKPNAEFAFIAPLALINAEDNYTRCGICVLEDGANSAKKQAVMFFVPSLNTIYGSEWSAYNGSESAILSTAWYQHVGFMRMRIKNATFWMDVCTDGQTWRQKATGTLSFTPQHYGLWFNCTASGVVVRAMYKFVRHASGAGASDFGTLQLGRVV